MKYKRTLLALLAVLALAWLLTVAAFGAEVVDSGACGEGLTWTLDANGTLTISGTGEMEDYLHKTPTWGVQEIKAVVLEKGVKSISTHAFIARDDIETVTLPQTLQTIGEEAFWQCNRLQSVQFSEGLKVIGRHAFRGCIALPEVKLPQSLETMDAGAFENCTALTAADLGGALKAVPALAFANCEALKTVTFAPTTETIGDSAFSRCAALETAELPAALKDIGQGAFSLAGLKTVTLPQGLQTIGSNAFANNETLSAIILPDGLTSVGDAAFAACRALKTVRVPNSVTALGVNAFNGCDALEDAALPEGLAQVPNGVFSGCKALKTVTLPQSAARIGDGAFAGCEALKLSALPATVTEIGADAFNGDAALTALALPDGLTTLGARAFKGCAALKESALPAGVTEIGEAAFENCAALQQVTLPQGITALESRTFYGCEKLESLQLPAGATKLGDEALRGCGALTALTLPAGLTALGKSALESCGKLQEIAVPQGVKTLSARTFANCTALQRITLPTGLTSIGADAFSGTAYAEDSANRTGDLLYLDTYLLARTWGEQPALTVKDGTTLLADEALDGASALRTLTLPVSLHFIGKDALRGCGAVQTVRYDGTEAQWHALTLENENAAPLRTATVACKTDTGEALTLTAVDMPETDSTCAVPGHIGGKQCSSCGKVLAAPTNKKLLAHTWEIRTNEGATCVTKGKVTYVCTVCGTTTTKQDVLAPDVHLHTEERAERPATCTKAGTAVGTYCTDCKKFTSGGETLPKLKHRWNITVTPATLKKSGKRTYVCTACGSKVEKTVAQIASVKLTQTAFVKDGTKHTPAVKVKDAAGKTLKQGTAYTVTYAAGRKNFGAYAVTVTFIGNYKGTKKLSFTVGLDTVKNVRAAKTGSTTATLQWSRTKYATAYMLYVSTTKNGTYQRFAQTDALRYNVSNLQPNKVYYFKVKARRDQNGKTYTGAASDALKLRTAKTQLSAAGRTLVEITPENRLLTVVNHDREIPAGYTPQTREIFRTGQSMDTEAAAAFEAMANAAKKDGVMLRPYSAYRSYARQKESYESIVRAYQAEGYSRSAAEKAAQRKSLPPGTSEHSLGLAVDINSTTQPFGKTKAFSWLQKNGWRYGFILRYPEGKEAVTGIMYEPWHWRYVGKENAKAIKKSGLTLDEYMAQYQTVY